jgi:hypothetical protein
MLGLAGCRKTAFASGRSLLAALFLLGVCRAVLPEEK